MAVNDIFRNVPVEIPNKSGFDEQHSHGFSAKVGTLVPAMADLLLPNDTISLGVASEIQLPPMATDFYGRVKGHFEAFFVPLRILYGGWQELITHPVDGQQYPSGTSDYQKAKYLPTLRISVKEMLAGSLSDYFGYGFADSASPVVPGTEQTIDVLNPLKYLAYHMIWDKWYRDSRIQQSAFGKPVYVESSGTIHRNAYFGSLPYQTLPGNSPVVMLNDSNHVDLNCMDGVPCYTLRQRNFGRDYFTNATPLPQAGQPAAVAFQTDAQGNGAFTIASLRAANSIQTWMERQNIAGYRYGDQIKANFGVYPSDAALDRPLYLGRQIVDVYNKSVYENDGSTIQSNTNNPFSSVGAKYGSPLGVGEGSLVDNFTASEHGYIFVMFSLVPEVLYSDTIEKDFWYNKMADFPFPLLQGVGDEPISVAELAGYTAGVLDGTSNPNPQMWLDTLKAATFGYQQRYANHKFKLDRISGLLKDDQSLQAFALQRSIALNNQNTVQLGSDFLEIPTSYLDNVSAVQGDVSTYGCWVEANFPYKKVSTLAAYSIPTLGDIKNTHTEVMENGGKRL